jgi:hypothetical protein
MASYISFVDATGHMVAGTAAPNVNTWVSCLTNGAPNITHVNTSQLLG